MEKFESVKIECKSYVELRMKKDGTGTYPALIVEFPNGYKKNCQIEYAERFIVNSLFE